MSAKKPNIVFFFTDDQRFNTVNALDNPEIITPHIDSLVNRGVSFTHAAIMGGTSGAVCMPSRAMLHSGRSLFNLQGTGGNIPKEHVTMGENFQKHGYNSWGTGKWHNGTESYNRSFNNGAEIFFGGMEDHWNVPANHYDPTGEYPGRRNHVWDFQSQAVAEQTCDHITPGKHSSELFADAAIDYLEDYQDDKPFFMYLSFMAPHDPRTMPKEYLDMYDPAKISLPENFLPEHPFDNGALRIRDEKLAGFPRGEDEVRRHLSEYYAMITHADAQIGRVIQTLEKIGELENTIIVFAGDNGLAVGCHGLFGKQNMYDHSIRVPLIFAGPGIKENVRTDAKCYLFDIFPTLCELVDAEIPESVNGKSLLPAINDPGEKVRDVRYFAYTGLQRAVRNDKFKLIEYAVKGERHTQLFDLENDPSEITNIAESKPEMVAELRKELARLREEYADTNDMFGKPFWEAMEWNK